MISRGVSRVLLRSHEAPEDDYQKGIEDLKEVGLIYVSVCCVSVCLSVCYTVHVCVVHVA